jgi:hypothetical protein
VKLHDPLTLPQVAAYHEAVFKASALAGKKGENASLAMYYNALMPGIYACVQDWSDLKGWTAKSAETFPASPREDALAMAAWLNTEVTKLVTEAGEEVPKASAEPPTPPQSDTGTPQS